MKNIDIIKGLSLKEMSVLLVRQFGELYASPSGNDFVDYDYAIKDCESWLNSNCEQTVNNFKNGKNFDL